MFHDRLSHRPVFLIASLQHSSEVDREVALFLLTPQSFGCLQLDFRILKSKPRRS
jgi:hypothetical protein